ncbi:zona pellucida sperm-binding protein 3-like [Chiroxiphia lanceolata]|uniref:zona pellucida sperm-binding protein 3-like n=1 Tax=Chiroxiphia lanceolata TaxID=296741 RepID=UPI0013CE922B|nr:zona pellucida sperm-binding protein 3-like [Chiroxiphia lanceolata]
MRSGSSLGLALLCWVFGEVVAYDPLGLFRGEAELWRYGGDPSLGQPRTFSQPWAWVDVSQLQAMAPLHPVAVQCQEAQLVVTVHRDLFGTGRLVRAADLSLGSASCLPVVWSTSETTVTFVAGLHECGSTLRVTPDSLIYTTSLNYSPALPSNPVVIRTSPAVVPIECHYPRRDNVSSHGVKPTWAPFRYTLSSEEKLPFSLRLMSDDWSAERASTVFQLGEVLHFQAGVDAENHVPLRLFVDSCVATLTPDRTSSPQYAFIEFSGCLVDGQVDDATSTFISPRPRQDVLQFAVDAFKFAGDSSNLIYVTCHLKVSPADQAPDPLNKACSFNKASNLWDPVEGTRDICSCCEMRSCGLARHSGRLHAPSRWSGGRVRRELPSQPDPLVKEADVVVGPLFIHSWQDHTVRRVPSQAAGHLWMVWGLAAVAGLVILILAVLGALIVCQKPSNPV